MGGEGGEGAKARVGGLIMVETGSSLLYLILCCLALMLCSDSFMIFFRTKMKTYHDVIPISCLTEFPNVVQMAKVGRVDLFVCRLTGLMLTSFYAFC